MIRETTNAEKRRHLESVLNEVKDVLKHYSDDKFLRASDKFMDDAEESGEVDDGQA